MAVTDAGRLNVSRDRWYNNPLVRSICFQVLLVVTVLGSVWLVHQQHHHQPP